jgi:hypothetical protein
MLNERQILDALEGANQQSPYVHFIPLGHPYSYLIDCRLNIFRAKDNDQWAIAAERLGYSVRAGEIALEIFYYGNCLQNLEEYNGSITNYYTVFPIDSNSFLNSTDGFSMNKEPGSWMVRGKQVVLSSNTKDYFANGIEPVEFEPGEITVEEAARLAVITYRDLFRATDPELYKSIPNELEKILVLDEWYHRDFILIDTGNFSDDNIKSMFHFNKDCLESSDIDLTHFEHLLQTRQAENEKINEQEWTNNRPGSYETWQQLAKVIATNQIKYYQPTLKSNTHWLNWPGSGSL